MNRKQEKILAAVFQGIKDLGWDISVYRHTDDNVKGMVIGVREYVDQIDAIIPKDFVMREGTTQ